MGAGCAATMGQPSLTPNTLLCHGGLGGDQPGVELVGAGKEELHLPLHPDPDSDRRLKVEGRFYDLRNNCTQRPQGDRGSIFSSFNNTFISMLCFVYKEFKTSVDED